MDTAARTQWRKDAGLDFQVKRVPVFYPGADGEMKAFKNREALVREDNDFGLGIVSQSSYKLVQPGQIDDFYAEFAAAGGMDLIAGGTFKGGKRVWAQAELRGAEVALPGKNGKLDISRPTFLLTTSYDGETATVGTFTMIRVVCMNTLQAAIHEGSKNGSGHTVTGFSIPHHRKFDANVAKAHVTNLIKAAAEYKRNAEMLSQTGVSHDTVMEYFIKLVGSVDVKNKLTSQSRAKVDRLVTLYREGPGADLDAAKGTAWGMLNAITRYVDHEAVERSEGGRTLSAWYGPGKELKQQALQEALQLVAA